MIRKFFLADEPSLYIDLRRVNDEVRLERRQEYAGDVSYRDRVKRRMALGKACAEPSLVKLWGLR